MRLFAFARWQCCFEGLQVVGKEASERPSILPNLLFPANFIGCEDFCEICLPKLPRMGNIRVLAGDNANENKVAE